MDLRELVKRNRWIYSSYFAIMNLVLSIVKVFIKTDDKLLLFVSYGGRHFNDSPKILYEAMLADTRFAGYKLLWAFRNPEMYKNEIKDSVRIDSFKFYRFALKARCWITNVSVTRGLSFKGKKTFYFHTTHVTLPKLSGFDVKDKNVFNTKSDLTYDCSIAQSPYEAHLQESMFALNSKQIFVTGLPKNDRLSKVSAEEVEELKDKLSLPQNKKLILYAPTYREDNPTGMRCQANFRLWHEILGDDYFIIFRVHPTVASETDLSEFKGFIGDYSSYSDNIDLMLVADALISDYSGIFFEFGVQDKPMYCYAYDYDDYIRKRALYFDIRKEIPGGYMSENNLLKLIKEGRKPAVMDKVHKFRSKYITEIGHATEQCLDIIIKNIK